MIALFRSRLVAPCAVYLVLGTFGLAQDLNLDTNQAPNQARNQTVQQIAELARQSVVVVTTQDRQGGQAGLGSGFVLSRDGLVATCLHVIGEARPIMVRLADQTEHAVIEVVASDAAYDLAILRIAAKDLRPLPLADSPLQEGDEVVAIGHPLGLTNSVVKGIVSGDRQFDRTRMWQVAMTVEPGNSGGPLLDLRGKVHGIVAMKSTDRQSFAFAVQSSFLKQLLENPNPISIERWKTVGRIDTNLWSPRMGAQWSQRGGRILAERAGDGFGGRSLLLRMGDLPEVPFEIMVSVKLDDESGAAGLVFHSDDNDRHYGFYPSAGRLRLTEFQGPNVFTWNVLHDLESEHYRRGDWNELKVRIEERQLIGYVNGHEVVRIGDVNLAPGRIGLCKFRNTRAEFKQFRFDKQVDSQVLTPEIQQLYAESVERLSPRAELVDATIAANLEDVTQRMAVLRRQAEDLERLAKEKREIANDLHTGAVCHQLMNLTGKELDADIDLLRGALWISKLDNPELDVDAYVAVVDQMARSVQAELKPDADATQIVASLDRYLFEQNGFHGSRTNYYSEANSHLDRVIDDREGLPISLAVLYIALADRLGAKVEGVGLPGHFVVRHQAEPDVLIDVFQRGQRMTRVEAEAMVRDIARTTLTDALLVAAKHRDILRRMLTNLLGVAQQHENPEAMLRYLEALVTLDPADASSRGMRGVLRHQQGRTTAALADIDWILDTKPAGVDLESVRQIRAQFAK